DLVLVDYVLPDIKGDEVCRRIGKNESTARVPIIMMSGHVHEMAKVASNLPNVVATIAKPFLSDALVALVQGTLKKGRLREKPKFPSEKEIARGRSAELGVSKVPIPRELERKPVPTAIKPPPMERGAPTTPSIPPPLPTPKVGGLEVVARSQTKAPPEERETIEPPLAANEVLLNLPLDVVSMQVNSAFQIGAIRARPASLMVAIEIPGFSAKPALPLKTGFHLGPIDLDAAGR